MSFGHCGGGGGGGGARGGAGAGLQKNFVQRRNMVFPPSASDFQREATKMRRNAREKLLLYHTALLRNCVKWGG